MIHNHLGDDLILSWPITIDDTETDLSQLDLKLYTSCYRFNKQLPFTVEDNTLNFTFFGKDQRVCGVYDLRLVLNENKEGQAVLDNKKVFRIFK